MKVLLNNTVIAESDETISVEGNHYFPPSSLKSEYFSVTDLHSTCPWKGYASYYTVKVGDEERVNAAWFYPEPKSGAAHIKDYVAFYRHMVKMEE